MKDYSRILEASKRNQLQRIVNLGADQKLNEWNLLRMIEEMCETMRSRIDAVMEQHYLQKVSGVNLQFSEISGKGKRLMLKAQVFRISNQEMQLKVFAHELLADGKAVRVARAVYQIRVLRDYGQGRAA